MPNSTVAWKTISVFHQKNETGLGYSKFENCQLNLASFFRLKIKGTIFKNCTLQEADFSETDLTKSSFDDCDLSRAIFNHSILEKVDFRSAFNYSIDPDRNRIRGAKFSMSGVIGLLGKYKIEVE